LKRLQTLWGLFCRQSQLDAKDRAARLGWLAGAVGRQLGSAKELTVEEAVTAIQAIQKHLPPELLRRKRPERRLAYAYGTAGRRGVDSKTVRMADADTWSLIDRLLGQLGWTRDRLDAFIRSSKSPLRGRLISTLGDANRVIWALKGMLRRADASAKRVIEDKPAQAAPAEPEVVA
jgi:hypothetical protein